MEKFLSTLPFYPYGAISLYGSLFCLLIWGLNAIVDTYRDIKSGKIVSSSNIYKKMLPAIVALIVLFIACFVGSLISNIFNIHVVICVVLLFVLAIICIFYCHKFIKQVKNSVSAEEV